MCLVSVILRFFSFFPSVIDHDESTYLEMAREMLEGKVLYVDVIDIKPPGIFLILSGFQLLFGYSIFFIRLLVTLWIGLTAFLIYSSGMLLFRDKKASVAGGIIYIFFISTWSFYGISITPEIFFNLFTILALWILLKYQSAWRYLLAGLVAGFGFIVKYFVMMDFAAFMLFFIFLKNYEEGRKPGFFKVTLQVALAGIGFALPFLAANIYYYATGHFDAFADMIYLAPSRYPSAFQPWRIIRYTLDLHIRFFPVFFFFYYALFDKRLRKPEISETRRLIIPWAILALFAVQLSGNNYGHYAIQFMLPVSLMGGLFFHSERPLPGLLGRFFHGRAWRITLAGLLILVASLKLEYFFRHDKPREIAAYLEPKLKPEDVIYTGNYHHILYYLLKKDSPTPYIHRSLLTVPRHLHAFGIDQEAEFAKIIEQQPLYILTEKDYPPNIMKDYIDENYELEKDFGDKVLLWRRK